jgi:5-formyltetrahydrofolate cyclo-ligase
MSKSTKEDFRKYCLNRLQFFSKKTRIKKDKNICSSILNIISFYNPKNILLYIPLSMEVDVQPLINILRKRKNIEVYVPYMQGETFFPVKYRLPLKKARFGIKQPNISNSRNRKIKLDMVIVPIVGIDDTYRRIGFGAGMYDRFYEKLEKKPITIFTQLKLCKSKIIVTSEHDIKPDFIITT